MSVDSQSHNTTHPLADGTRYSTAPADNQYAGGLATFGRLARDAFASIGAAKLMNTRSGRSMRRAMRLWAAALLTLVLTATQGLSLATAQDTLAYRLSSGDKVRVTVFGHEDLSGEFEVDPQGRISLPLVQYVDAHGSTAQELESNITAALSPDYLKNPRVSVEVLNYRPFYILGEVENPGSYDYVNGMTVLESVAVAGGFTYRAKQKKMTIVRASDPEKKKMPAAVDTRVLPGDVIEVPERRW